MSKKTITNSDSNLISTDSDRTLILPVWKGGYHSKFKSTILIVGLLLIFSSEIIGKKTNYEIIRPSYLIRQTGDCFNWVFTNVGYCLAYISDIAYLFRKLFTLLHNILQSIWLSVRDAFIDIFGALGVVLYQSISGFFDGYQIGLGSSYNILMTYMTSIIIFICFNTLIVLSLEAIGIAHGLSKIRPSYYIIGFANHFYFVAWILSYVYTTFGKVLTNFKIVLEKIITRLLLFLTPLFQKLRNASNYFINSISTTFEAPFMGVLNGFNFAVENFQKHYLLTGVIALLCCILTIILVFGYINK